MASAACVQDGSERPLRLRADDVEDLQVVSALAQDAVLPASEMTWDHKRRRFACLINRFRWEAVEVRERRDPHLERVQAVLAVDDAISVRRQGPAPEVSQDIVLSLLMLSFRPDRDGMGRVVLTFAGDAAVEVEVEALNVTLQDVSRTYEAPSQRTPEHPE
ncbi:MAG: DUF2948 family protein [Boseongicola sp. SB0676_bin_33]|uniref:DUF2948 family protein n=1 Tax=Boseongicola sp. SB0664_bin_43 TaxID=2604844 RepID=A0A6B0Y033_9RHOB|nr:DUF2948 family protein [Boseongicola sp. SB0664_bin_43]MYF88984.1 DUF2948 family protein [Boseongicola sp. SB0676_bin_33]MYK31797.1 DUF2948 family protein [Boseongicola sp. SB0670_bin_30]